MSSRKKEYKVDCVRCGEADVDFDEELNNPFCGPCKQDVLLMSDVHELWNDSSRSVEFDDEDDFYENED